MTTAEQKEQALAAVRSKKDKYARMEGILLEADDEMMEMFRGVFAPTNGSHRDDTPSSVSKPHAEPKQRRLPSGNGRGDINAAIRAAVASLKTKISVRSVQDEIERRGVRSSAKRPGATIRPVLSILVEEGQLKETIPSRGTKPAEYEFVGGDM